MDDLAKIIKDKDSLEKQEKGKHRASNRYDYVEELISES